MPRRSDDPMSSGIGQHLGQLRGFPVRWIAEEHALEQRLDDRRKAVLGNAGVEICNRRGAVVAKPAAVDQNQGGDSPWRQMACFHHHPAAHRMADQDGAGQIFRFEQIGDIAAQRIVVHRRPAPG